MKTNYRLLFIPMSIIIVLPDFPYSDSSSGRPYLPAIVKLLNVGITDSLFWNLTHCFKLSESV